MKITRRNFVKISGIALSAFGFLYPGVELPLANLVSDFEKVQPSAEPAPTGEMRQVSGADPTYASGEVVEKTLDGVILKSDIGVRAVRISDETIVWKEFDTKPDEIELHDWLDVKGEPLSDGSLRALSGWVFVNIGRREGIIEDLPVGSVVIRDAKGTQYIELSSRLELISATDGLPLAGGITALKQGTPIGMVGLRLPNGGFRATRIWTE